MTVDDKTPQEPPTTETGREGGTERDQDSGSAPEELREELEKARQQVAEYHDQLLRARADLDNLRRRTERELANAHKYAIEKFALELLPVRDSLKLGLEAASSGGEIERLREGMELTLKMLTDVMAKFGISEVNPEGDRFNPELHQAMSVSEADHVDPNTVLTVHQHGYLLHDRLIRPAMVVVSGPKKAGKDERQAQETVEQSGGTP